MPAVSSARRHDGGEGKAVPEAARAPPHPLAIGAIAFLTLIDLFAAQAILPALARVYAVTPSAMAAAVNSCTLGMALGAALCGVLTPRLDHRRAVAGLLAALALPTLALAAAPDLATFAALRVMQGLLMSAAFAWSLAHLSEAGMGMASASAAAAYITGNVASNLLGRLLASWLAGAHGTSIAFGAFAVLNVAGAALVMAAFAPPARSRAAVVTHTSARRSAAGRIELAPLAIGFAILFAFIGVFSYVGFVLMSPPLALSMMQSGFVYLVFVPSLMTTPFAKPLASRIGAPAALRLALAMALAGLPLLVTRQLEATLAGLALVAAGTFLAQAVATGEVGRRSGAGAARANALYLASYFAGGLAGSAVVGLVYETWGWPAAVATVAAPLIVALVLAGALARDGAAARTARPTIS